MNGNRMAYPMGDDSMYKAEFGLTKLELISAMCLTNIMEFSVEDTKHITCAKAISHAKELLKQLEAEND